jgi:hypothetical protein
MDDAIIILKLRLDAARKNYERSRKIEKNIRQEYLLGRIEGVRDALDMLIATKYIEKDQK